MTDPKAKIVVAAEDKASPTIRRIVGEIKSMSAEVLSARSVLAPLNGAVAGAFTVGAIGAWVNRTVEGVDALNDLVDATGDSVENLSALEDIALRTGTSMETASSAVIKLNKALIEASRDRDSEPARAIKNIGLNIKELMALGPVERLQAVGRALNNFGGENKLEYNLALLGKSTAKLAPLLKDLGEAGKLQAKVTAQQAAEAEKLRKEWASMQKDALDLSRTLVGPLVSSLNQTIDKIKEAKGFWETLKAIDQAGSEDIGVKLGLAASTGVEGLRKELAGIDGALGNVQLPPQMRIDYQERRLKLVQQIAEAEKKATEGFLRGDKDRSPVDLPGLPALGDKPDRAAEKRAAEERRKLAEEAARARVDVEEQAAKDAAEAWSFYDKSELARSDERAAALKEQWKQVFDAIDADQERAIEEGKQYLDALGDKGKSVGEEIGLVFASAAGEAITHWQGYRNLLKGILLDLAQVVAKKGVTDPLGKAVGSVIDGIDFKEIGANILKFLTFGANGLAFDGGGVRRFAAGDVFGSPTLFRYGGGRMGMMGEAGPEAVMPLKRGPDGKLGVAGGGGSFVFNFHLPAGANVDDWRRSQRQIEAGLQRSLRRAGAIA